MQSAFAETALSAQEADSLTKEDIAATQVLADICPTLLGNSPKFKNKIDELLQSSLKQLSQPITLEQLKQDPEYISALKETQESAKQVDQAEHKVACTDVLAL